TLETALKKKPCPLSTALAKALREDLAAEAKSKGDIVGLDFDPFLNSQDPVDHYRVASIKKVGKGYAATIMDAKTPGTTEASVIAEVAKIRGRWQFTNFRYPASGDLLKELATLKGDRAKAKP